ncbi:hypothetical protein DdX_03657 [Ditylenchus destructor]|uniref:Uncharacterized protein n=1 Tax=Ditylenchus destructor TaxID=166010 RepID=A0AAD4N967_9BILA|nr:hypothetical protein DdX_03657 [Ditylenchus destructor]
MPKSSQPKRIPFSEDEDASMWKFFLGKIRRRDRDALNLKHSIWMEYAATCTNNRAYHTLEKRFRNIMLPRIHLAPISDEDIVLIIEQCKVILENHEAVSSLKKRLKALCEFSIASDLAVQKVVRKDSTQASHPDTSHSTLASGVSGDDLITDSGSSTNSDSSVENDEAHRRFSEDTQVSHPASSSQNLASSRKRTYFGLKKKKNLHENVNVTDDGVEVDKSRSTDTSSRTVPKACTRENEAARRSSTISQCGLEDEEEENEPTPSRTVKMRLSQQLQRINSSKDQSLLLEDEETTNELMWHEKLVEYKLLENNRGETIQEVFMWKELLRLRIYLVLKKAIPVDKILDGVPDNIQSEIKELTDALKWCLSTDEALPSVLEPLFANCK